MAEGVAQRAGTVIGTVASFAAPIVSGDGAWAMAAAPMVAASLDEGERPVLKAAGGMLLRASLAGIALAFVPPIPRHWCR